MSSWDDLVDQFDGGEKFDPAIDEDFRPNPVQAEFIRLAAQQHYYIAFADTSHEHLAHSALALNTETVRTLAEAGKKYYFIESPARTQEYFDFLQAPDSVNPERTWWYSTLPPCERAINGWLGKRDAETLTSIFEKAARENGTIKFVAADERNEWLCTAGFRFASAMDLLLMGVSCLMPFFRAACEEAAERIAREVIKAVAADDRTIVSRMKSFDGPAAILFGAGHLAGWSEELRGPGTSMRTLLPEKENNLCVFNIFRDEKTWKQHLRIQSDEGLTDMPPDANLYVLPSVRAPHGIEIVNPALQPLYDQAKRKVGSPGRRRDFPTPEA